MFFGTVFSRFCVAPFVDGVGVEENAIDLPRVYGLNYTEVTAALAPFEVLVKTHQEHPGLLLLAAHAQTTEVHEPHPKGVLINTSRPAEHVSTKGQPLAYWLSLNGAGQWQGALEVLKVVSPRSFEAALTLRFMSAEFTPQPEVDLS